MMRIFLWLTLLVGTVYSAPQDLSAYEKVLIRPVGENYRDRYVFDDIQFEKQRAPYKELDSIPPLTPTAYEGEYDLETCMVFSMRMISHLPHPSFHQAATSDICDCIGIVVKNLHNGAMFVSHMERNSDMEDFKSHLQQFVAVAENAVEIHCVTAHNSNFLLAFKKVLEDLGLRMTSLTRKNLQGVFYPAEEPNPSFSTAYLPENLYDTFKELLENNPIEFDRRYVDGYSLFVDSRTGFIGFDIPNSPLKNILDWFAYGDIPDQELKEFLLQKFSTFDYAQKIKLWAENPSPQYLLLS